MTIKIKKYTPVYSVVDLGDGLLDVSSAETLKFDFYTSDKNAILLGDTRGSFLVNQLKNITDIDSRDAFYLISFTKLIGKYHGFVVLNTYVYIS